MNGIERLNQINAALDAIILALPQESWQKSREALYGSIVALVEERLNPQDTIYKMEVASLTMTIKHALMSNPLPTRADWAKQRAANYMAQPVITPEPSICGGR